MVHFFDFDPGEPYSVNISFIPSSLAFNVRVNGENVVDSFPSGWSSLKEYSSVNMTGDTEVSFFGFVPKGKQHILI